MNIRTGTGDTGTTQILGNLRIDKTHDIIKYVGALDTINSLSIYLEKEEYISIFQDLIYSLSCIVGLSSPYTKFNKKIMEINTILETNIKSISEKLKPLKFFIRTNQLNHNLMFLRTQVRECEILCNQVYKDINTLNIEFRLDLCESLQLSMKSLNILSDWIFVLLWEKHEKEILTFDRKVIFD